MAPNTTKASLFLISAVIAKLAFAGRALVFPEADCEDTGYYMTLDTNRDTCSETVLIDRDFQLSGNSSGFYDAFFSLRTEEEQGCALIIGGSSVDAEVPPCGECVVLMHTPYQCVKAQLPSHFCAWECSGEDCETQCGQIPAKRTITPEAETAEVNTMTPDIANLKNRSPFSSHPKAKRSDCHFATPAEGRVFSQAGYPVKVSNTVNTCPSPNGCEQMYSGTVESSFSQGFDISSSTEAGFFDIVSETISFGYSATWESSQSVSVSGTYTFSEGQGGYMTFSPLSSCILSTFSGADCAGMGIPTGGDARSACVPQMIAGGSINGDINVVTSV